MTELQEQRPDIWERIIKEFPINNDGNLTQKVSSVNRLNAAIKGVEIYLNNQWIEITDNNMKPEPYKMIQITDGSHVFVGWVCELGTWNSYNQSIVASKNITHFQPLPNPHNHE